MVVGSFDQKTKKAIMSEGQFVEGQWQEGQWSKKANTTRRPKYNRDLPQLLQNNSGIKFTRPTYITHM